MTRATIDPASVSSQRSAYLHWTRRLMSWNSPAMRSSGSRTSAAAAMPALPDPRFVRKLDARRVLIALAQVAHQLCERRFHLVLHLATSSFSRMPTWSSGFE